LKRLVDAGVDLPIGFAASSEAHYQPSIQQTLTALGPGQ